MWKGQKVTKKQNEEDSCPSDDENVDEQEEPDWMDLVRPVPTFHDQLPPDFEYDDGGGEILTGQYQDMYTQKITIKNG